MKHEPVKSLGSYELDERAAIKEFEAHLTRKQAEMEALRELGRGTK